ncbi:hypothetical protein LXA43DRAFT_939422 [Ganoderma leucocontextum]|nr:hypothetical protein LXA43DRAFT_939422 [Ganoderma leucocontextum]
MSDSPQEPETLQYSSDFWEEVFAGQETPKDTTGKLHLVFSLLVYLALPLHHLLVFAFSSHIKAVRTRANRFFDYRTHAGAESTEPPGRIFWPERVYRLWHENWVNAQGHLHELIVQPCAEEVAVEESDELIKEPSFRIKRSSLTMASIRCLMSPTTILSVIKEKAPFTYRLLHAFTTAPNEYRKKKFRRTGEGMVQAAGERAEEDISSEAGGMDEEGDDGDPEAADDALGNNKWEDLYPGFARNPTSVIMVVICMCLFVRNRATNVLALPLGLFLKISGTSERVLTLLSNIGLSVSSTTVERVKERISEDAVRLAVSLITGATLFYIIFDNINLYLRKFQERIYNRHTMIHATNAAVIAISEGDTAKVEDVASKLEQRGKRIHAKWDDIRPTQEDAECMGRSFECLIAEMLVRYTPGNGTWTGRAEMLEKIRADMPNDRPLPPEKTDARPLGVLNVNEGSKKGLISVLEGLQQKSTFDQPAWASKTRIMQGDWLTSNNFRAARRERKDDITPFHRLEYVEELSALWHFGLNATHMIVRTHFGVAVTDPTSLAAHKGLLRRTWDAKKPNYAAAKSLIRHSLIARLLRCVMYVASSPRWSALSKWRPTYNEIRELAKRIQKEFTQSATARAASNAGDDWQAHEVYFIRDALLFLVFEHGVSTADAGIVLRVLKYWALSFRGASQHNYARECVEILVRWKYELSDELRAALERAWFVNRWGEPGRWIAADLYLEQCNFWVKVIFIASGNGVTIEYIMKKGSACVEAFRDMSHLMANLFGDSDRHRRSKEVAFYEDMRVLVEDMTKRKSHILASKQHFVPHMKKTKGGGERSAIVDSMVLGAEIWRSGKFDEYIRTTAWDPEVGYLMDQEKDGQHEERYDTDTAFDDCHANVLEADEFVDLHGDENATSGGGVTSTGALGGGDEFATGMEAF